ncbi:hypothetical protein AHAS_Ahas18G0125100 [Arachis hypogaea]
MMPGFDLGPEMMYYVSAFNNLLNCNPFLAGCFVVSSEYLIAMHNFPRVGALITNTTAVSKVPNMLKIVKYEEDGYGVVKNLEIPQVLQTGSDRQMVTMSSLCKF